MPEDVAIQIAAGEVIERPSSIVKELVENALDAGAKSISVKIKDGGITLIEVLDDGYGIAADQLKLALATHSTSKLKNLADLESIYTMGFRGEALASIAAVSKLSIASRSVGAPEASVIEATGGKIGEIRAAPLGEGTRVVVRDIFYNLPARRKFLRTKATEFFNIEQTFIRLALANPSVAFSLTRDDKQIYKLPALTGGTGVAGGTAGIDAGTGGIDGGIDAGTGGTAGIDAGAAGTDAGIDAGTGGTAGIDGGEGRAGGTDAGIDAARFARVEDLLGKEMSGQMLAVNEENLGYSLRGWVIAPAAAKSGASPQFLYVNGRFVRDKVFANAVRRGYEERLHGQRNPAYILFLDLPANEVDVNVHPAKNEVRFHKGQQVHTLVRRAISKVLATKIEQPGGDAAGAATAINSGDGMSGIQGDFAAAGTASRQVGESLAGYGGGGGGTSSQPRSPHTVGGGGTSSQPRSPHTVGGGTAISDYEQLRDALSSRDQDASSTASPATTAGSNKDKQANGGDKGTGFSPPLGYAVSQLHGIYIISVNSEGLVIVDMHAAHERIVFEQLKEQQAEQAIEVQQFLLPLSVELSAGELELAVEMRDKFHRWGIELRALGKTELAVDAMPALLSKERLPELLQNLLQDFRLHSAEGENVKDELNEKILGTMACYGAIRANRNLTVTEMNSLLRKLEKTKSGHLCNHGRPTWFTIKREDIDKQLLRGQ